MVEACPCKQGHTLANCYFIVKKEDAGIKKCCLTSVKQRLQELKNKKLKKIEEIFLSRNDTRH